MLKVARGLIVLLVFAFALQAYAETKRALRIGYLISGAQRSDYEDEFEKGLAEAGYRPGENVSIDYRPTPRNAAEIDPIMQSFVAAKVDAIVVASTVGARPAMRATKTIPVILGAARDAVGDGLVQSLARPGGNVTGQSVHTTELAAKRLQTLREAFPEARRFGVFWTRSNPHPVQLEEARKAALALGIEAIMIGLDVPEELDAAFAQAKKQGAVAGFMVSDISTISNRVQIGEASIRQQFPVLVSNRRYLTGGALMSYGPDIAAGFRRAAVQMVRALNSHGEIPPVEQPARFELVIDMRAVKALGVKLPEHLMPLADEVIE